MGNLLISKKDHYHLIITELLTLWVNSIHFFLISQLLGAIFTEQTSILFSFSWLEFLLYTVAAIHSRYKD